MRDAKSIVLVVVIVLLIGSAGFLTYMISNGQDPLVLLNTRAKSDDEFTDPDLLADAGDASNGQIPNTPTISFTSTSPTTALSEGPNSTMTPTKAMTPQPSIIPLPETGGGTTPKPTPVTELPVAGVSDYVNAAVISGGILILLAMLL